MAMYIESVPNRQSPPAVLLRESYRDAGKVKKRTLANLTKWPPPSCRAGQIKRQPDGLVSFGGFFRFRSDASEVFVVKVRLCHFQVPSTAVLSRARSRYARCAGWQGCARRLKADRSRTADDGVLEDQRDFGGARSVTGVGPSQVASSLLMPCMPSRKRHVAWSKTAGLTMSSPR